MSPNCQVIKDDDSDWTQIPDTKTMNLKLVNRILRIILKMISQR